MVKLSRIAICVIAAVVGGCAVQPADGEKSRELPAEEVTETDASSDSGNAPLPVAIHPVPSACELLLASLDDTQPLLSSLEKSLTAQTERLQAAMNKLDEPQRRQSARECPKPVASIGDKEIIGAIEWLYMDPPGRHFRARVDSGAETSSLSASDVVEFERDGKDWIRFNFEGDRASDEVHFELPIKRTVLVRQVSSVEPERRFVVDIDIRLGDQLQRTEFTLTDRSRMTYPVLLGRAFLMDLYVVDVSRSYTHERYNAGD